MDGNIFAKTTGVRMPVNAGNDRTIRLAGKAELTA